MSIAMYVNPALDYTMSAPRNSMPIMSATLLSEIPWAMIAPHEVQARANHSQSLARLAERGRLCAAEALDVLEGRRWGSAKVCIENEHDQINLVRRWRAENGQVKP